MSDDKDIEAMRDIFRDFATEGEPWLIQATFVMMSSLMKIVEMGQGGALGSFAINGHEVTFSLQHGSGEQINMRKVMEDFAMEKMMETEGEIQ